MIMSVGWLSRSYKSSIIWYGGVHTAMPFLFLCRLPLIVSMPQYPLYHFKDLFTASPQPRHTRGLLWARVFHGNAVLPKKTLACQSGRPKNVAQTRLQESIGYVALHLCLSLQVPLLDTLPDGRPIIRTDMPSHPSSLFYS